MTELREALVMRRLLTPLFAIALLLSLSHARADESFSGKTITMLIGSAPGGGTDASGRLIAPYLAKYLPGQPNVLVRNMPGADGITALNFFVQQAKADGLTVLMGAAAQVDPLTYRRGNAQYDPATLRYIGGIGRGGSVLVINAEAEKRLMDKSMSPVVMGSNAAQPRQAMQITLWGVEYLGWNVKWVVGYPGTNEVMLALERGEIDMTATGNMFQIQKLLDRGTFRILNQSGGMENGKPIPRPDFGDAPLFPELMKGRIKDPMAAKSFDYWIAMNNTDKWLALPPGTPDTIVAPYRTAFDSAIADPEFTKQGKGMSEDLTPMRWPDIESIIRTLVGTPNEATEYTKQLMRSQGLRVE